MTSITSYLLIGYYAAKPESRAAALQALLVTGLGGLALMAGLILLGRIAGTFEISEILALGPAPIISSPLFPATLILILLGAFTKSAQFPFHFWLPNAMAAPAPVSSFCTPPPWSKPASSSSPAYTPFLTTTPSGSSSSRPSALSP